MVRVVGVTLGENQRIEYALTAVYGIGFGLSRKLLNTLSVDMNKRVKDLTEEEVKKIQDAVEKTYTVEGDLKEEIAGNIKRLKEIGIYRGMRHARSLPSRGQRTKSNARTRRGKRKTVGALKKEDMVKLQDAATKK